MKQDFSLPPAPKRPLGEVNIWLTSIGLSLGLIMIFGLLGIIVVNGLEAFWPKTIHELTIAPSSKEEQPLVLYAGITKDQTRHVPADPARPGSTARDVREYQLFTGSKEIYGQSYRYVDAHNITASATPKGLLCLERMEGGESPGQTSGTQAVLRANHPRRLTGIHGGFPSCAGPGNGTEGQDQSH